MKLEKLSPSAINTWFQCPYKFYCNYIDKREQIKTPDTTTFGSTIHNILDSYYDSITENTTIEEIPELIERKYTELGNWATQARKQATRKTQESFLRFEKYRLKHNLGLPTLREKKMYATLSKELPIIYGIPDLYFEKSGLIVDWKTGKWGELSDDIKIQGKVYKLILEANGYHPKSVRFEYLVLGTTVPLPDVSTGWVESKLEEIVHLAKNKKFRKNRNPLCEKWCGYRLDCDLDGSCPWWIL